MESKQTQSIPLSIQLWLWCTVTLWASALVGIRVGLHGYSPGVLALLRYLVASVCLFILYVRLPHRRLPKLGDFLHIAVIGIFGIGMYNVFINYGEIVVPAGIAGFILGLMPVFNVILAFLLLGERIPIKSWLGVLVSLAGLLLIAFSHTGGVTYNIGILYILVAAILGSYYTVAQKKLFHLYDPLELVILSIWTGTLPLLFYLPGLIRELPHASWEATASGVYLGVFPGAIAYALWNFALSKAPAGRISGYLYAMPIIATLLGMILLQEYPRPLELTGGLITLIGAITIHYCYKHYKGRYDNETERE